MTPGEGEKTFKNGEKQKFFYIKIALLQEYIERIFGISEIMRERNIINRIKRS